MPADALFRFYNICEVQVTTQHTLWVCALCKFSAAEPLREGISGGQYLFDRLAEQLADSPLRSHLTLQPVRCMAACGQACNVALTAPGKLTFILNNLAPAASASDLLAFCRQYAACDDGKVPYRDRAEAIKQATAYVLPPCSNVLS
jgi:predicted metal-binding protein